MKRAFLLSAMVFALVMITACKHANNTEIDKDITRCTDTIPLTDTAFAEQTEEVAQNEDILPTYFDFCPWEEYVLIIKGALRYDKNLGVGLDSAIRMYADDQIPADSILICWNSWQKPEISGW